MKHLILPDNDERRLIFYLSMEEFAAREMDGEAFFLWQVSPTVIFGRNQLMEAEVNVPFCREHGIKMFRRKSGGGCVYSDWGNIMVSYIVKGEDVTATFNTFLQRLASALRDIGVDATVSGRNDIQIGGRKVSGNAFYKVPGKSIVHGTLLFASDFERMQQAITPSAVKLQSKGVASVRQHVTNLSEHTDMPIEEIEQTYLDESFFNGSNPAYTVTKSEKIAGVGEVAVGLEMRSDIIHHISLSGDYFMLSDPMPALNSLLRGKRIDEAAEALKGIDMGRHIANLTTTQLTEIILKS